MAQYRHPGLDPGSRATRTPLTCRPWIPAFAGMTQYCHRHPSKSRLCGRGSISSPRTWSGVQSNTHPSHPPPLDTRLRGYDAVLSPPPLKVSPLRVWLRIVTPDLIRGPEQHAPLSPTALDTRLRGYDAVLSPPPLKVSPLRVGLNIVTPDLIRGPEQHAPLSPAAPGYPPSRVW